MCSLSFPFFKRFRPYSLTSLLNRSAFENSPYILTKKKRTHPIARSYLKTKTRRDITTNRSMQQSKEISAFVKDLSLRSSRELLSERSFQITTTIIFCLSMSFFVVVIGMFINDHTRKYIVSEEFNFPLHPLSYSSLSPSPTLLCNSSSDDDYVAWIAPKELWHSMSDEELMWRASMTPLIADYPYNRTPKVAFMFMARGRLSLAPIWERFFKGHNGLFSIYLHLAPDFAEEPHESSVFYKRRIPSKLVEWGRATMIDAERRLLSNALLDFSNERFVLLSETCIPVFNFTTVYDYLIKSNHSFLGSFDDPRPIGRGRYNKRMWPTISISDWRKGSQWFEVRRKLAVEIVSDGKFYPLFKYHCKPPCYMDEHYLPTLVTQLNPEQNSNRSITWVDWSRGGSHPTWFVRKDISTAFLNRIRYESNCTYNGNVSSICFLFARKFHPTTLEPLLRIAPTLFGFDL